MATYKTATCNRCGNEITCSGPHEFVFKDKQIVDLPHPGGKFADGIYYNIFCKICKKNHQFILVEFKEKAENPWSVLKTNIKEEYLERYSGFIRDHPSDKEISTECCNITAIYCPVCGPFNVFDDNFSSVIMPRGSLDECPYCGDKIKKSYFSMT